MLISIASVIGACTFSSSKVFLTTKAPDEVFTVEMTGNPHAPKFPIGEHEVRFNLLKNSLLIVQGAYVDEFDSMDSDFAGMYPKHKWIGNNVVRFGVDLDMSEESPDLITISNNTDQTIKYLKIVAGDLLFVFEMSPRSKTRVKVPHNDWISWVWGEVELSNGNKLKGNGANFFHRGWLSEPLRYCLSVDEAGIRVESPNMEGYLDQSTIPIARKCDE